MEILTAQWRQIWELETRDENGDLDKYRRLGVRHWEDAFGERLGDFGEWSRTIDDLEATFEQWLQLKTILFCLRVNTGHDLLQGESYAPTHPL